MKSIVITVFLFVQTIDIAYSTCTTPVIPFTTQCNINADCGSSLICNSNHICVYPNMGTFYNCLILNLKDFLVR